MRRLARSLVALAVSWPGLARAADLEFLPELRLRLSGARYAPAERDFQWVAWMGGGASFLRAGRVTAFGSADVETVVGNERRGFDANQANYHLEVGIAREFGRRRLAVFFNHVSRHAQDRPKPQAVDWNTLGARLSGTLAERPLPLRFELSAGHTTLASLIGYRFEGVLGLEADLVKRPRHALYLLARARAVTTEASAEFPRDGFLDLRLETGARAERGGRVFQGFLAFERRNDVYLVVPGARERALLGIRFSLEGR